MLNDVALDYIVANYGVMLSSYYHAVYSSGDTSVVFHSYLRFPIRAEIRQEFAFPHLCQTAA